MAKKEDKKEVYVKCSTCEYEGTIEIDDKTAIYDAPCPKCEKLTLFLYFVFPVAGG